MFFRSFVSADTSFQSAAASSYSAQSAGKPNETAAGRKKKYLINPADLKEQDIRLIKAILSAHPEKTFYYEDDFPAFSLRSEEYELNTVPPLLLMKQDEKNSAKRYYYLLGGEFHDGKFGVKIYQVKGVFTLSGESLSFRKIKGLLAKKQFVSKKKRLDDIFKEYQFNVAAGISQPGFVFNNADSHGYTTLFFMRTVKGDNLEKWKSTRRWFSTMQLLGLCLNAISAVRLIHNLGIVHRDIKPANLIANVDNPDDPDVRLIDFDMSKMAEEDDAGHAPGTRGYVAPEIYRKENTDFKSDVFSLGMVFSEILGFHYLFNPAKAQCSRPESPFMLLDTERYDTALTTKLMRFLEAMTHIEKAGRYALYEAELELARIMLFHQAALIGSAHRQFGTVSRKSIADSLEKLAQEGCVEAVLDAVKLLRKAHEYIRKVEYKLGNKHSLTAILSEFMFAACLLAVEHAEAAQRDERLRQLFVKHLDKMFIQACLEDDLKLMQFLLSQGASFSRIYKESASISDLSGRGAQGKAHEFLQLCEQVNNIEKDDNRYRGEALQSLTQCTATMTLDEIRQSVKHFLMIDAHIVKLRRQFASLSFQTDTELFINCFGKAYRYLTTHTDSKKIMLCLTKVVDELKLMTAATLLKNQRADQLNEYIIQFPEVLKLSLGDGTTLLHLAVQLSDSQLIHQLIIAGCDPDQARLDGMTPRQMASLRDVGGFSQPVRIVV